MIQLYNFRWVIDNVLAGCSRPFSREDMGWLSRQGIKSVVCLVENPIYYREAAEVGFDYLAIPVEDYHAPTLEQAVQFVDYVNSMRLQNKPVAVFCDAGLGRTGCMLASYLVSQGSTPENAITEVRQSNKQSIHTQIQIDVVYDYWRKTRKKTDASNT